MEDVTWHLNEGDRVGLAGPNGSGKTTLLQDVERGRSRRTTERSPRPRGTTVGYLPSGRSHATPGSRSETRPSPRSRSVLALGEEIGDASRHRPERTRRPRATKHHELMAALRRVSERVRPPQRIRRSRARPKRSFSDSGSRKSRQLDDPYGQRSAAAGRCGSRSRSSFSRAAESAAPRRADEPPRSRGAELARGFSHPNVPARDGARLARSLLPRSGGQPHHRYRSQEASSTTRGTTAAS